MGKPTGFMEFDRADSPSRDPLVRVRDFEEFHRDLSERQRRNQGGRCMDCGVPFCQAGVLFDGKRLGCPLHNLIPEWNDQLWQGRFDYALTRLLKTNCFPEFTGRVCPAPCEDACTCGMIGESVTVRDNELFIIESAFENGLMAPKPPARRSDKRIAVVGSGPAGLSAAYWLNHRGHSVTVFERDPEPGGLLMYGIPNMKLPKDIVRRRAALMEKEGVAFKTGVDVCRDVSLEALAADFDCVIMCCGAQKPRPVPFEGSAGSGVYYALDYLKETGPRPDAKGKRVFVIGAGDSASDCVATALRQGCADVVQLVRKPASFYSDETDYAHEESMAILSRDIRRFETQVKSVSAGEDGALKAVTIKGPAGEETLEAELLIIASGFSGSEDYIAEVVKNPPANVFFAGDMALGASLVVLAIADGKAAAAKADGFLMGYTNI